MQAAAREMPASSKKEILHGETGMIARRSPGFPSLGGVQNSTGQDSELPKSRFETR